MSKYFKNFASAESILMSDSIIGFDNILETIRKIADSIPEENHPNAFSSFVTFCNVQPKGVGDSPPKGGRVYNKFMYVTDLCTLNSPYFFLIQNNHSIAYFLLILPMCFICFFNNGILNPIQINIVY